jgi:hypothetical protein
VLRPKHFRQLSGDFFDSPLLKCVRGWKPWLLFPFSNSTADRNVVGFDSSVVTSQGTLSRSDSVQFGLLNVTMRRVPFCDIRLNTEPELFRLQRCFQVLPFAVYRCVPTIAAVTICRRCHCWGGEPLNYFTGRKRYRGVLKQPQLTLFFRIRQTGQYFF